MFHDTQRAADSVAIDPRHTLIDRDTERQRLAPLLARLGASLALETGRRRIGMTFLLARTWPYDSTFLAPGGVDERFAAAAKAHPEPVVVLTSEDVARHEGASA